MAGQRILKFSLYVASLLVILWIFGNLMQRFSEECSPTLQGRIFRVVNPYVYGLTCSEYVDESVGWFGHLVRKMNDFLLGSKDAHHHCVLDWRVMKFTFTVTLYECEATNAGYSWMISGVFLLSTGIVIMTLLWSEAFQRKYMRWNKKQLVGTDNKKSSPVKATSSSDEKLDVDNRQKSVAKGVLDDKANVLALDEQTNCTKNAETTEIVGEKAAATNETMENTSVQGPSKEKKLEKSKASETEKVVKPGTEVQDKVEKNSQATAAPPGVCPKQLIGSEKSNAGNEKKSAENDQKKREKKTPQNGGKSTFASTSAKVSEVTYVKDIAGCRIVGKIADGSFATAYIAKVIDSSKFLKRSASCTRNETFPDYVAMKFSDKITLRRCQFRANFIKMAKNEMKIMTTSVTCPFLMNAITVFQTIDHLVFVMPMMCGSLVEYEHLFTPRKLVLAAAEMISGLIHLHLMGYIHRDIKLDNILVSISGHLKLSDFGCSQAKVYGRRKNYGLVGTVSYTAPEIYHRLPYNESCDYWSLGICLYILREGKYPTVDAKQGRATAIDKIPFPDATDREKEFIKALLRLDPEQRLGSPTCRDGDIRTHDYFTGIDFDKLWDGFYIAPCPGMRDLAEEYVLKDEADLTFEGVPVSSVGEVSPEDQKIFDGFPTLSD